MAAKPTIAHVAYVISIPVVLAIALAILPIANYKLGGGVWMPGPITYLVARILFVAGAGYLVTYRASTGLWGAAFAGAFVMFAEHLLVRGLWFIIDGQPQSALNVLLSFSWLAPIAMVIGAVGGYAGIAHRNHGRAAI